MGLWSLLRWRDTVVVSLDKTRTIYLSSATAAVMMIMRMAVMMMAITRQ